MGCPATKNETPHFRVIEGGARPSLQPSDPRREQGPLVVPIAVPKPIYREHQLSRDAKVLSLDLSHGKLHLRSFNAADQLSKIEVSEDGGALDSLLTLQRDDSNGQLSKRTARTSTGAVVSTDYDYHWRGFEQRRVSRNGTEASDSVIFSQTVNTFDANGLVTGESFNFLGHEHDQRVYHYDQLNRLRSEQRDSRDIDHNWSYDGVGNWTETNHLSKDLANAVQVDALVVNGDNEYIQVKDVNDQLPEIFDGLTPIYDLRGQVSEMGRASEGERRRFVYDWANRLVEVQDVDSLHWVARYEYDALGRRVIKREYDSGDGTLIKTTRFVYDGSRVIEEYELNESGEQSLKTSYVHGEVVDEMVVRYEHDGEHVQEFFYLSDRSMNVQMLIDGVGEVVERYSYNAFGLRTVLQSSALVNNDFGFSGRRLDEETGLMYYRARYYSAEMGRFMSRDPLGYVDGLNMYAYVGNNPLNFVDPSGMIARDIGSFLRDPSMLTFENIFRAPGNDTPMIGEQFIGADGLVYTSRAQGELDNYSVTSSQDINGHQIYYDNPYFDTSNLTADVTWYRTSNGVMYSQITSFDWTDPWDYAEYIWSPLQNIGAVASHQSVNAGKIIGLVDTGIEVVVDSVGGTGTYQAGQDFLLTHPQFAGPIDEIALSPLRLGRHVLKGANRTKLVDGSFDVSQVVGKSKRLSQRVYGPAMESGHTRKLQDAFRASLDDDVILAVRDRPYRANSLDLESDEF